MSCRIGISRRSDLSCVRGLAPNSYKGPLLSWPLSQDALFKIAELGLYNLYDHLTAAPPAGNSFAPRHHHVAVVCFLSVRDAANVSHRPSQTEWREGVL